MYGAVFRAEKVKIMGAYTFYSDEEIKHYQALLADEELRILIDEVNKATSQKYFVRQYDFSVKRALIKPLKKPLFSLYVKVSQGEVKCINFSPLDFKASSLNYTVEKAFIVTYFLGILTGVKYSEK